MKKTISLLLALVMALSLLPAAVWATEDGAGDTAGETTEEAYAPFASLPAGGAAENFVKTYIVYDEVQGGYLLQGVTLINDNSEIADDDSAEKAKEALDAYENLDEKARSELDSVVLFEYEENEVTYQVTFADLMSQFANIYKNYVDPYKPFDKLTDTKAVEFADKYIDCGRWGDEYWAWVKDVRADYGIIAKDSLDQAKAALDAYAALPSAAKTGLDTVTLKDGDRTVTVSELMADLSRMYMQSVTTGDKVTDPAQLTGDGADAARAFLRQYMDYTAGSDGMELRVKDVAYDDYGALTSQSRDWMLAACRAYNALPLAARVQLERLTIGGSNWQANFSDRMVDFYNEANEPATGSKTELNNENAQKFLADNGITYKAVTHTITIAGVERKSDGFLTAASVDKAMNVWKAWDVFRNNGDGDAYYALYELQLYWDNQPVRFPWLMDNLRWLAERTMYDDSGYVEEKFKAAGFKPMEKGTDPGQFDIDFPDGLVEGVDYTYTVKDGVLTVTVKRGDKSHWLAAAQQTQKDLAGNVYFYLTFYKPTDATKCAHDTGNGLDGVWDKYYDNTEINTAQLADGDMGNARAIAAVNRDGDLLTITSSGYESEKAVISWFDDKGESKGKYILGIRVVFEDTFSYEYSVPAARQVSASHITTGVDNSADWKVQKDDGLLTLRPADSGTTLKALLGSDGKETITTVTLTPPEAGYEIDRDKSSKSSENIQWDGNSKATFVQRAFNQNTTVSYYTFVWTKSGAPDITEELTVRITEAKSYMADVKSENGKTSNPATTAEVGTPPAGMQVTYDEILGYFYTSAKGGKMPSVEDLQQGITLKAPDDAKYFRFTDWGGNENFAYLDEGRSRELADALKSSTRFDTSNREDCRHLAVPYVQTNSVQVGDVTVYFAANQLYRARIVEWLDENENSLGYTYVYGKNGSFVQSVTTPAADVLTELVEDATIISKKDGLTLTCNRYPQEGDDKTVYMRLTVNNDEMLDPNGNEIYLPYSYFPGLSWELAQKLAEKPVVRHYKDGEQAEPEVLEGEYTAYGIRFRVKSFSPFTVTWTDKEKTSSTGTYYYYNTGSTGTSSASPRTFDAGVGVYALTAALSVTGMTWLKKKHRG
jgi:hypothetical protein